MVPVIYMLCNVMVTESIDFIPRKCSVTNIYNYTPTVLSLVKYVFGV